jgi:hypothetical protein
VPTYCIVYGFSSTGDHKENERGARMHEPRLDGVLDREARDSGRNPSWPPVSARKRQGRSWHRFYMPPSLIKRDHGRRKKISGV